MKIKISDLSMEELKALFDSNSKLREIVWNNALENTDFWVSEYLQGLSRKAANYDIGYCGAWMDVKNCGSFLEWVESCNNKFGIFYGMENLIEKAFTLNEKLLYWDLSDLNYERVENRLDEICDILASLFVDNCWKEYDYIDNSENIFDFFLSDINSANWDRYFLEDGKLIMEYTVRKEIA